MKRSFISLGLIVAATFALTNCTKDIENPSDKPETAGIPFEIIASTADTKTTNDGLNTNWAAEDAINLFHAEAGATTYGTNDKFTITSENLASNKFTGELTDALAAGKTYDWYALYPYNVNVATPGEKEVGYTYIGYSSGLNQTGYDSMASLKNTVCPLYGVAKAVPADETPNLVMEHLSSVVAIKITNANDEPLTVANASFTATEDIVGSYFIDITKTPVAYTAKTAYETATVNVISGATPLAEGESATLYLAIKPFTASEGSVLKLSVNGYEKELLLPKDVTFHAGKIKTLNFSYDKPAGPDYSGDYVAVVFKSGEYVYLTSDASGSRLATVNSGVTEITDYTTSLTNFSTVDPEYVWTVDKINSSSYYTMCANSKYIKKVSTTSNYAYTDASVNNAEPLNLVYNETDRYFTITSTTANYSGRTLSVNTSNEYYAFYGNTSQLYKIVLIPYEEDKTPNLDVPANVQTVVDNASKKITVSWNAVANATDYDVTCGEAIYNVTGTACEIIVDEYGIYDLYVTANAAGYRSSKTDIIKVEVTDPSVSVSVVEFICSDDVFSAVDGSLVATISPITVCQAKGEGQNFNTKYTSPLRFYGANTLTVSGAVITKVEFTFDNGYKNDANVKADSGTYNSGVWTSNEGVNSVVFTNGQKNTAQVRITKITVTYKN